MEIVNCLTLCVEQQGIFLICILLQWCLHQVLSVSQHVLNNKAHSRNIFIYSGVYINKGVQFCYAVSCFEVVLY